MNDEDLCNKVEEIVKQLDVKSSVLKLLVERVKSNNCEMDKIKKENLTLNHVLMVEQKFSKTHYNENKVLKVKLAQSEAKIEKVARMGYLIPLIFKYHCITLAQSLFK